jgi:hypothetical protein
VHNFLSREGTAPDELLRIARSQLRPYDVELCSGVVKAAVKRQGRFELRLAGGRRVRTKKLLRATGIRDNCPDIPGFRRFVGRGVYYCSYCDGYTVRDRPSRLSVAGSTERSSRWHSRRGAATYSSVPTASRDPAARCARSWSVTGSACAVTGSCGSRAAHTLSGSCSSAASGWDAPGQRRGREVDVGGRLDAPRADPCMRTRPGPPAHQMWAAERRARDPERPAVPALGEPKAPLRPLHQNLATGSASELFCQRLPPATTPSAAGSRQAACTKGRVRRCAAGGPLERGPSDAPRHMAPPRMRHGAVLPWPTELSGPAALPLR